MTLQYVTNAPIESYTLILNEETNRDKTIQVVVRHTDGSTQEHTTIMAKDAKIQYHNKCGYWNIGTGIDRCMHCGELLNRPKANIDEIQAQMVQVLRKIPPEEQEILRLRFGLEGEKKHRIREIAEQLNVENNRVTEIANQFVVMIKATRQR